MDKHKLEIVEGAQGLAVYLNDLRISPRGSKPLGGGVTLRSWDVDPETITEALERRKK